jgi:hypothetical protein
MAILELETLSTALAQASGRWQPRQTPHSNLSDAEKKALVSIPRQSRGLYFVSRSKRLLRGR